ncbi:MAG TPA: 4-hydroxybenzoyl-CoA reductase subunit alpha [Terriglobia bacterium]|jgi:4-hydroxybenzoyl-CoA reductase subunit alpha|nr:4-hydroxybenzoyl-CoA reductase subunit alpha [Terriglobia bacterium]
MGETVLKDSPIGARVPMIDSVDKVTGKGIYTDDMAPPGTLTGRILHSPHAHARILSIDTSVAERLPGVKAVVTGRETPVKYGILPIGHDETIFATDKVRYVGDNVAGVAAESPEIAEEALRLIRVEYEVLPAWFDPEKSMLAESNLIHEDKPHNIEKDYHHHFGDVVKGFEAADYIREDRFFCPEVTHAALEPHSTLAEYYPEADAITVWSSTQVPYYLKLNLASTLQMPEEKVRVIKPLVGGGFGGKSEVIPLELAAAVLARKALLPVKITYSREEVFYAHRGRPGQIVELRTGITREGRLTAVEARIIQDGGAYCSYGVVTILYSGQLLNAMYEIPNVKFDGYRVLTNKPACGAMRGHGTVNTRFAFEQQLNRMASVLGIDPVEIRRRNLLKAPCITVNGLRVLSYGFPECLDKVEERSGWREKHGKLPYGKGIGIAGSHYVSGAANAIIRSGAPHTTVNLSIDRDGVVTIFTGASEIGQGSDTLQVQVVAAELGVDLDRVKIVAADTARTPIDLGSYSSRVTFMAGNAAIAAARDAKGKVLAAAAVKMATNPENLAIEGNQVMCLDDRRIAMPFEDAVRLAAGDGQTLEATGSYRPPDAATGGKFKGGGVGPSPAYSYCAQTAEVTVDPETGQVTVDRLIAAHDCGKAINPICVEGQVIGSVWMGLGQAVQEEMMWRDGRLMNPGLLEYRSASTLESPPIEAIIVESNDPEGPFGAKEAGEGSLAATIPAVTQAIYDAVGVWIDTLPITPEKILKAIAEKKKSETQVIKTEN